MIEFRVIIDTSESDFDTFYLDIKGTRYEYLKILDLKKMREKVVKELEEDENGNPKLVEKVVYCEPEIEFKKDWRYLVLGVKSYQFVKDNIHLGPRGENFYDLTKMDYLLTREGYIFKFSYVRFKRYSEFISKAQYDKLLPNLEMVQRRLKWCELIENTSKRTGKPYYMMAYYKLEDTNNSMNEFIDKEDLLVEPPKMKSNTLVRTVDEINNAFDFLDAYEKLYGLDYETSGFPFDDEDFYHMGVGITTQDGDGFYFDMDWMQVQAENGDDKHWDCFLKRYKKFNDEKAEMCYTYNVSFEQRCTYLLYGVLYFYHEGSSINKLESLVKKNYSLKYTAMRSLHVASWDNDFEMLSDDLGQIMIWKDKSFRHKPSEVFYTNCQEEVEKWVRNEDGEVSGEEYKRLDCETLFFTDSPQWQEIREAFPEYIDEIYKLVVERWGLPFKCIPAEIHLNYCPLDSFYTVLLPLKATERYTWKCWDCFDNNLRMGALLDIHGIPLDEDYRQWMEDVSTSQILWSKLNLVKWWVNVQLSYVAQEIKDFPYFKYYFANFNNIEAWKHRDWLYGGYFADKAVVTPSNLSEILNMIVDENGMIDENISKTCFGEEITEWVVNEFGVFVDKNNISKEVSKKYTEFFNENCYYNVIDSNSHLKEERLLTFVWFNHVCTVDASIDDIRQYFVWLIQKKQIDFLLSEVDQEKPRLVYQFLTDKGTIEERDGYEISQWIKDAVFNFNSNNNFLDICLMVYNYYGEIMNEVMSWEEGVQFEDDEDLEGRMTGSYHYPEGFDNEIVEEWDEDGTDEEGKPTITHYAYTRHDQFRRDYAPFKYLEKLKPYIENLGVEPVKEKRIRVNEETGQEEAYYYEYMLDVKQTKEYRDYLRNGDVLWCFMRLCSIDGLIFHRSLQLNRQGEEEFIFRDQMITEEPFWEIPVNAASDGNFYWLCMLSFRDRVIGNYNTKKMFEKLYYEHDIMEKSIIGVTKLQYFFTNFRKYEKVLGTYVVGQFGSKYVHTCNKEDKNLICTERYYDENKKYLKIFSPYKTCQKQSKRWSAPMHTVPSKSEVKRCVTTPPGYLLSYFK